MRRATVIDHGGKLVSKAPSATLRQRRILHPISQELCRWTRERSMYRATNTRALTAWARQFGWDDAFAIERSTRMES